MARAIEDDYSDLEDLEESDELTENFLKAAKHLTTLVTRVDEKILLQLYGYYKQATEGPCNIEQPGWYNPKNRTKWEAWKKLGEMPKKEAKTLYIQNISKIDGNFLNASLKDTWIKISTMQANDESLKDSEKGLVDFVKEGEFQKVLEIIKAHSAESIKEKINKLDEQGLGLIHWTADRGFSDLLKLLIEYGADVNLIDLDGQTALHYAASCGNVECIKLLINSGALLLIRDTNGLIPEEVACDENILALFKM